MTQIHTTSNGTKIYTAPDGRRYIKGTKSNGDVYGYYLEGDSHQVSEPEEGVNYINGFTPGYATRVNTNGFKIEPETTTLPEIKITGKLPISSISLNTDATKLVPRIKGIYASEDEDIYNSQDLLATRDINLSATDEQVRRGWGDKGRLQVAGMLGAGALGATVGAYTLPALWGVAGSEIMGAANLYGGYHGVNNLLGENGLLKTWNLINKGDYEGALYSGIGDLFDIGTVALPAYNLYKYFSPYRLAYNINKNSTISDSRTTILDDEYFTRDLTDSGFMHVEPRNTLIKNPNGESPMFSFEELFDLSKIRSSKVLNDSEYKESLMRELGVDEEKAQQIIDTQLKRINESKIEDKLISRNENVSGRTASPKYSVNNKNYDFDTYPQLSFLDGLRIYDADSAEVFNSIVKNYTSDKKALLPIRKFAGDGFNLTVDLNPYYKERLLEENNRNFYESIRLILNHENFHVGTRSGEFRSPLTNSAESLIYRHNKLYLPRLKPNGDAKLFKNPDEVRARAMSLRRLHQTTGKSYYELLNDLNIVNSNTDIKELVKNFNLDDLENYLLHFVYNEDLQDNINQINYAKFGNKLRKWNKKNHGL